jgi:hypothetical protein
VRLDVVLGRMLGVFGGMHMMAMRRVRVVRGSFVVAFDVMLRGFLVVARSVLVVFRCLGMMMGCFF